MYRFKFGWILIAVVLVFVAIGSAIIYSNQNDRSHNLGDRDPNRDLAAEPLSKGFPSVKQKSVATKSSETAAMLRQAAPPSGEWGQDTQVDDPKTRKQPIRIKTH